MKRAYFYFLFVLMASVMMTFREATGNIFLRWPNLKDFEDFEKFEVDTAVLRIVAIENKY